MKIITVLGTRPEIIKFSPLLPLFDHEFDHILIHTGQHYDQNMDQVFFNELQLKPPAEFLNVGTAGAGASAQTGRMLERLEPLVAAAKPDCVAVLGDTNSTLAGSLVAAKLNVPVAHVEAGCRSFNRAMPEEQNRVVVDHLSDLLFAPDEEAVRHLRREGIDNGRVHLVGNTGLDATRRTMEFATKERLGPFHVEPESFVVATIHRAENTNDPSRLRGIIEALNCIANRTKVMFPVHPRTSAVLEREAIRLAPGVTTLPPLGNLDFVALLRYSLFIMSDSGGIQEEAAVVNRPCLVLREETEWTRLVESGKNFLVGTSTANIVDIANKLLDSPALRAEVAIRKSLLQYGASERIVRILKHHAWAACAVLNS